MSEASVLLPGAAERDLGPILADHARDGIARLGPTISPAALEALRARADEIMLGRVAYPGLFFQLDTTTGDYDDLEFGKGWRGPSLNYRKIEKLELDPVYLELIRNPLYLRIARAVVEAPHEAPPGSVVLYRAVLMNKAAHGGTVLPWHQDGGRFWGLSEDPVLQIWTALDDASEAAGCVEAIPGSHRAGLATPLGGLVPAEHALAAGAEARAVPFPARAGEALLIHNHVWHRSGINRTAAPRRAFTVCYMSRRVRCLRKKRAPRRFFVVG